MLKQAHFCTPFTHRARGLRTASSRTGRLRGLRRCALAREAGGRAAATQHTGCPLHFLPFFAIGPLPGLPFAPSLPFGTWLKAGWVGGWRLRLGLNPAASGRHPSGAGSSPKCVERPRAKRVCVSEGGPGRRELWHELAAALPGQTRDRLRLPPSSPKP